MNRAALSILLFALVSPAVHAQAKPTDDQFTQAMSQGDLYQSRKKFDLALDAYRKADKLCRHSSAACYLKIASVERKLGDFPAALEDAKRSEKAAGEDKTAALQAHLFRATLLSQMSGKPTDKKLREAEDELRQALALDATVPIAHFDLGMVLLKQERDPDGLAELNTFVDLPNADAKTVAEARRVIASPVRARAPFAPDFSFTTHQNENLSNAALRGKVVLLDFWGTWCPPCRESVPVVRNLQKKYTGKNLQIVGISSDDDEQVWQTFIKAQQMTWSEYIDVRGDVLQAFGIDSFPTYIVLDKDGVIRFRQSGFGEGTQDELEEAINKALKRESDPKLAAAAAADASDSASSNAPTPSRTVSGASSSAAQPAAASTSSANGGIKNSPKPDAAAESAAKYEGLEGGYVTAGVYINKEVSMSYKFPDAWIPASVDLLHAVNERTEGAAKATILQQHPEMSDSVRVNIPKVVFYASRKGNWDGQHYDLPSIRIMASPSRAEEINPSAFEQLVSSRATASGMKVVSEPSMFEVNKHRFFRADFDHAVGAVHVYQSLVQTIAEDYLLNIELYAYSSEELNQAAASLKAMSITDEDP